MADILIRGLEMPKGCKSCKLSSDDHCNATGQWLFSTDLLRSGFNWKTCRLPDCPLVELQEHGDLIDICNAENALFVAGNYHLNDYRQGWNDGIKAVIENAPVIIQAGEEETK